MNKVGMHYGFWSHNWNEIVYPPLIEKASSLGFDILEVASAEWGYYTEQKLSELYKIGVDNGVSFSYSIGLEPEYDLASDDTAVRENGIKHVTRILKSMPKVGATVLNGVSYAGWQSMPAHGITMDEKRKKEDIAIKSLKPLLKIAEDCGVDYCFEAVNRFEQYLINTSQEAVEFCKKTDSKAAKVLLDTFHMNIEEDDIETAIETAGSYLGHFHVGENNRKPPGTGKLPWDKIASSLKKINYTGAVVMEPFVLMGGSIAYDIKVWRDIANDASEQQLDDMAKKSCSFMKNILE